MFRLIVILLKMETIMLARKSPFLLLCFTFFFAIFVWGCKPMTPPAQSTEPQVTIEPTDLPILESSPIPSATSISRPSPTPIDSADDAWIRLSGLLYGALQYGRLLALATR
jgi:hypothetical protein